MADSPSAQLRQLSHWIDEWIDEDRRITNRHLALRARREIGLATPQEAEDLEYRREENRGLGMDLLEEWTELNGLMDVFTAEEDGVLMELARKLQDGGCGPLGDPI